MVLGLLLITATGMIIDTIDNIMEAKHLDCPPFRIDFAAQQKLFLQLRRMLPPTTLSSRMCKTF